MSDLNRMLQHWPDYTKQLLAVQQDEMLSAVQKFVRLKVLVAGCRLYKTDEKVWWENKHKCTKWQDGHCFATQRWPWASYAEFNL